MTKILIVGAGSIGERHTRTFTQVKGVEVGLVEQRRERLELIAKRYGLKKYYTDLDNVDLSGYDGMVICTPLKTHIGLAKTAVKNGLHVLIEKPLSFDLKGISGLISEGRKKKLVMGVAYCLRHHPNFARIKRMVDSGLIGRPLMYKATVGQHFPVFRPDYKTIYFAKKETGGGVLVDFSCHTVDLVKAIMGTAVDVFCYDNKISKLEIKSDDTTILVIGFEDNTVGEISVNCFQHNYEYLTEINGEEGSIVWNYPESKVGHYNLKTKKWKYYTDKTERDDLFVNQARNFVNAVNGREKIAVPVEDGLKTLKVILSAKKSCVMRRTIKIIK